MTYKELFGGWHCRDGYANHTLYVNCYRPDKLSTVAEILQNNERASRTITELESYITLTKTLDDGTQVKELSETYTGKERRQAIARFEALKKERPGIEAIKDIEKKAWER